MRFTLKKTFIDNNENEKDIEKNNIQKNKILLVWGSQNSGKSVISTFIDRGLAKKYNDKNIALLYTDENLPIIPCFFSDKKLENAESLGAFYTPLNINKNYLLENIMTLKDIENLALLGFQKGEHFVMYTSITDNLIQQLFKTLKEEFDFIIIDGTTFFQANQISFQAFEFADIHLKIKENDIKSISYFSSAENFINSVGIKMKNTKALLNKSKNETEVT